MLTVARKPAARPARLGRCPQRAESPPGFTLMELLVSFSLIGLVAVFIHLGYSIGLSAREKAEAYLEAYQAAQASMDVLSRQIASMVPYVSNQEHEERPVPVLLFRASPRSLGFVTTWSAASGFAGGLRFVQYFTADAAPDADSSAAPDPAPAGRRLLLNERPLPPEAGLRGPVIRGVVKTEDNRFLAELARPRPGPRSLTLAQGLASVTFRRLARPQEESFPLGSRIDPRRFRRRSRRAYRPQLPAGIQLSLRWNGQGPGARRTLSWPCPSGATEGQGCVFKLS